jgi:hypothetical protein
MDTKMNKTSVIHVETVEIDLDFLFLKITMFTRSNFEVKGCVWRSLRTFEVTIVTVRVPVAISNNNFSWL